MVTLLSLRNAFWLLTATLQVALFVYLFRRKLLRSHAAFVVYIASTITQSAMAVLVYRYWGFDSPKTSKMIWASQAVILALRYFAVFETAGRMLSPFLGIWTLAKRVLGFIGVAALLYSFIFASKEWSLVVLNLDRGLELAIATFVVVLLLFARYYMLPVHPLDRALATGFCLYSCFFVINDSLLQTFSKRYMYLWGYLDILTFLASVLIWFNAVRAYAPLRNPVPTQKELGVGVYGQLSPQLNFRLRALNEQLTQLLHAGNHR